jgi:hypothetical protein
MVSASYILTLHTLVADSGILRVHVFLKEYRVFETGQEMQRLQKMLGITIGNC